MVREHTGAWRKITKEEFVVLEAKGEAVDWIEGAGYIVHDDQALTEFRADSARIAAQNRS